MSELNKDWKPSFGTMYYWLAIDKNGKIARMMNNNWGDIPKVLLQQEGIEHTLDSISEYLWDESFVHTSYIQNKKGETILDLYPSFPNLRSREYMINWVKENSKHNLELRDENLPSIKGIYIYQAIDGYKQGDDYPIGYDKKTEMGDYYRYLMPTVYASIHDFPKDLWHGIAISHNLDFTKDQLIPNKYINSCFLNTASNSKRSVGHR